MEDADVEVELPAHTLIEIANELDIPLDAVAGALVESKLGVERQRSILDRLVGPTEIWARRSTKESEPEGEVMSRLVSWLEQGHGLRSRARRDGVLVAKNRRGLAGKIGKTVRGVQGLGGLSKADHVEAVVIDLDDDAEGSIGLAADLSSQRSTAVAAGSAVMLGGTAFVSLVSLATAPVTLVALPLVAGASLATSRRIYGSTVDAVTDAVEETIDGVVMDTEPPGLLGGLRRSRSD